MMVIPHNSKCRYGERGAASAGAVLKPQGGNCAVLPSVVYADFVSAYLEEGLLYGRIYYPFAG